MKPPHTLGTYDLEERVAAGGMGEIWRARSSETGEQVAVKRILMHKEHRETLGQRLVREAQALQLLEHDNVVRYLDSGMEEGPYLVLEWLEGRDLVHTCRKRAVGIKELLAVMRQVLTGLAYCHERGVVHRDIKPANIFLLEPPVPTSAGAPEGPTAPLQVKIVDFGLALLGGDVTRMTATGQVMGTPNYLAPEQARGVADVDFRTDLYAAGVVLYELCTGRLPFTSDQPAAILIKIITETPPKPRQIRPELPRWLEEVILRAMQRAPSDRFESAAQMAKALRGPRQRQISIEAPRRAGLAERVALAETMPPSRVPSASMELRLVSMLCVKLLDPEREAVVGRITALLRQHGGLVHELIGRQLIALFGLELTQGDEALRAVRAGLAALDQLKRGCRLLVATLHVEVRDGLTLNARDLDATMALVPRLPPGALVVDAATRGLVADKVELVRVGTHEAVVREVEGAPARRRVLGRKTPTVGREGELATLRAVFHRVADYEEPEVALVHGPAGIGKTRLYHELAPSLTARAAVTLTGRADVALGRTPYKLLAQAVADHAGLHVGQDPRVQREALAALLTDLGLEPERREENLPFLCEVMGIADPASTSLEMARADPQLMRQRIAGAFEALLEAAGRAGPVVLLLEDLHWADEASIELCEQLIGRLDRTPLFVLATCRPELLERRPRLFEAAGATRVELPRLRAGPLRRLLKAVLGHGVSRELEQVIGSWCDGNPFFAEELVAWLVREEVLILEGETWRLRGDPAALELPLGVEGAIQGRLDGLGPELKELLRAAAIYGQIFWQAGCEAMGFADVAGKLRQLEAAELIDPLAGSRIVGTRAWSFRHALVQQVAYKMLHPEARQPLHRSAARWLEQAGEPDAAVLAAHFERAGEQVQAAAYYAKAGGRALAEGNLRRAVECFEASLIDEMTLQTQASRSKGLARALILLGRYDEAWKLLSRLSWEQLSEGDQDPVLLAELDYLKGRVLYAQGKNALAEELLQGALTRLQGTAQYDLVFNIRHTQFWVQWVEAHYTDAENTAGVLLEEAQQALRPDHLCAAQMALAYFNVVQGDLSLAVRLAAEAVEHAQAASHPYREVDALMLVGTTKGLVGRHDEAKDWLAKAMAAAERLGTAWHRANIENCLGTEALSRGDDTVGLEHYTRAAAIAAEGSGDRTLATGLVGQGRAMLRLARTGDGATLEQAESTARRAVEVAASQALPAKAEAAAVLAQILLEAGNLTEAASEARRAVAILDQLGAIEMMETRLLFTAYRVFKSVGDAELSRTMLARAAELIRQRADRIVNVDVRESYLNDSHHAEVLRHWRTSQAER